MAWGLCSAFPRRTRIRSAYTALINEALCKILCHNLRCLIQSAYELGIVAKFWGTDGSDVPEPEVAAELDMADAFAWV